MNREDSRGSLGRTICGLLVLLGVLMPSHGHSAVSATYYVRNSGSDANTGRSPATAFATITRGAEEAGAGSTVIVGPGRYAEGDIRPRGTGQQKEPIVFFADRLGEFTGDAPGDVIVDAAGFQSGFKLSGQREWVVVSGFSVTNAEGDGVFVKDQSDNCVIANCIVFSNKGRGVMVRGSADVVVFNNLVYGNGEAGIMFEGEETKDGPGIASPRGVVINNTVHGNGEDGLTVGEDPVPSEEMTVLNNVITENAGIGLNLKENSSAGFVGQWNLVYQENPANCYRSLEFARGSLDLSARPLFVGLVASGGTPGTGLEDDDFHLAQVSTGHGEESPAVDASPVKAKKLGLSNASTRIDGRRDAGLGDLGFHSGSQSALVLALRRTKKSPTWKVRKSFDKLVKKLRKKDARCEKKVAAARNKLDRGRGPCVKKGSRAHLARSCGSAVIELCR